MQFKVIQAFNWAHHGVSVQSYEPGMVIETDEQALIEVGQAEGWIEAEGKAKKPPENAANKNAPENKSLADTVKSVKKKLSNFLNNAN